MVFTLNSPWLVKGRLCAASSLAVVQASGARGPDKARTGIRRRPSAPRLAPAPGPVTGPVPDELGCPHFDSCSGCTLNTDIVSPPVLESGVAYFRQHGVAFELDSVGPHHWRHRARLAVQRGSTGKPLIGLFKQGSHKVVAIPRCVAHHPAINSAAAVIGSCMQACSVTPYDEATGSGELRYVQLTVVSGPSAATHPTVQVALVWNTEAGAPARRLQHLAEEIWSRAGFGGQPPSRESPAAGGRRGQRRNAKRQQQQLHLVHSVWANLQPTRTNTIFGPQWRLLHGPELTWARLGGADICFGPASFLQVNFEAMDRCLQVMQSWVPKSASVVDLHAGVGTIGLSLAATRQPRWVRFVEINAAGEAPFRHSAARLAATFDAGPSSGEHDGSGSSGSSPSPPLLEYHVAAAGSEPGRWLEGGEVVVVDPPRKGLEPQLLQFLSSREALQPHPSLRRVLYLSCGFPAFMRDCDALLSSGQWRLTHAQGFLFFPATNHIETLAVFDRCIR